MTSPSFLRLVLGTALTAFAGVQFAAAAVTADPPAAPGAQPSAAQLEFFEKSIRPVLVDKCYKCHSAEAEKDKGGLLLDTREGLRQGGDSGHAVVPGNVEESVLIQALRWHDKDLRMPPEKEGGKLPDSVIVDFEKWVKMGAPDPRDGKKQIANKEIDFEQAKKFWAFQTPKAAAPPAVKDASWPRSEVDRFVRAAQEAKGLAPVADADERPLLRRVYFDLIGLPPSPQDVDAFLKDTSRMRSPKSSTGCSPCRSSASAGAGTGWMRRATPRAPARSATSLFPAPGGIAIT